MKNRIVNLSWRCSCALLLSLLGFVPATRAATVTVHVGPIGNTMTFSPAEVSIALGDTVQWIWDSDFHSVTSGTAPFSSGDFDSEVQTVPFTFSHTFLTAGNFDYFCIVHKMMTGVVHVSGTSTVSLAPLKDNTLYEDPEGQTSNGQGIYLFAGKTNVPTLRRGLIAFDLTGIPMNATIMDASLSMFLSATNVTDPTAVSLSTVSRDWGEGASDAGEPGGFGIQAETDDATWLHTFYAISFWTTPGGDFSSTPSATTMVSTVDTTYTWNGSGLLADVTGWVANPATNFGWVIRANEVDAGTAKRFNTGENSSNPPRLSVTYQFSFGTPTPTPSGTPGITPTPPPATPTPPPATPTPTPTPTPSATPTVTPSTFGNISTRLRVETGDNALIGGFIVTGTQPKRVIVRAIGPSLPFPGSLANPTLELRDSSGALIRSNDDWRSDQEAEIIATTIPPSNDLESAIVAILPANNSAYTATVRGVNDGTGIGVVEAYDLNRAVNSKLANISTRGLVQTGDNVLIGGLIVLGQNPVRVIVRAIGPSLPVTGSLADPTLELRDGNGGLIDANDNWRSDHEAEIIATTIPPSNDLESAIVRNLAPGNYTAVVRGVSDSTGVGVVEAYNLN
jgi:plastocyanin